MQLSVFVYGHPFSSHPDIVFILVFRGRASKRQDYREEYKKRQREHDQIDHFTLRGSGFTIYKYLLRPKLVARKRARAKR